MILSADEVNRSLKGAVDLLHSRTEGLKAFDMSERGFWRSFAAIWLALPAYVVSIAMERLRLGLLLPDRALFGSIWLDVAVALGFAASFLALPLAMIWLSRKLRRTDRYVPFVIVTNWISVMALLALSVPALLLVIGWATPALACLFSVAFAIIFARLQWFATRATLGVSSGLAFCIVLLGLMLNLAIGEIMQSLIG
ncbi:hypothetical protein [Microvirga flavescens]|uniref:hypothetical protein n=1 Tax=Microvirga flavescens TaxID=2249811 RepID=UPI000DDA4478|nr:hypothetical protein [Microvirga flavescens]